MTHEPQRLQRDAELGPLLREAERGYRAGLDEAGAFRRLSAGLERPAPNGVRRLQLGLGLGAALALSVAALLGPLHGSSEGTRVALSPERSSERAGNEPASIITAAREQQSVTVTHTTSDAEQLPSSDPSPLPEALPAPEAPLPPLAERAPSPARVADPAPPAPATPRSEPAPSPRRPQAPRPARAGHLESPPARSTPAPSAPVSANDCFEIARRLGPAPAEQCFWRRAAGSGLGAERALLEMARWRQEMLSDALGALGALDAYRQRFPLGALRRDVELSRVELLAQLQRRREALAASEALLDSARDQRAAQLHVLRGNLFEQSREWSAAAGEYALAEPLGGAYGTEASRLRARCLEQLGDRQGARAAYGRYLESAPDSPRRPEVEQRLQALQRQP